jgi:hypothetical protein
METDSKEHLQALAMEASLRAKRRITESGTYCAALFKVNGRTFEDCTTEVDAQVPIRNKEWCYIDNPKPGEKTWDYCRPIMDYDKVREANQNEIKEIIVNIRKAEKELETLLQDGQRALDELRRVKEGQADVEAKINNLMKEQTTLNNNLQNLYNLKALWEKEEQKALEAYTLREQALLKQREALLNNQPQLMPTTDDVIQSEMALDKCSINPFIQEKIMDLSIGCKGKLLYEEDSSGDGLLGQYFDNEYFLGEFKEQVDPIIDYDWTGSSPVNGVNPTNFSVRWEGFLYAPFTGLFKFAVETDGGAILSINNRPVVAHDMFVDVNETKVRVDNWFSKLIQKATNPGKNYYKTTSTDVKLMGGTKYKIVISYTHSIFADIFEENKSFVKVFWSSNEFDEMIIPHAYLYSQNTQSPLKVSGIKSEIAVVRKLNENDLAFKNSDKYVLQDIPTKFRGLTCIKLNTKYMESELKFELNMPAYVYIGRLAYYPNPVPVDYENTNEFMSLLQLEKVGQNQQPGVINATHSALIKIYRKKYDAGQITIALDKHKGVNAKGMPLIVFFGIDSSTSVGISCGGDEILLSKDPKAYKGAKTREGSEVSASWKADFAFVDKNRDTAGQMWASKDKTGAWVEVEFKDLFQVTKIDIFNRRIPNDRMKAVLVEFSNGDKRTFELRDKESQQTFMVEPPVRSYKVKFTITAMFGTGNAGGAFRVYGVSCINPDDNFGNDSPGASQLDKVIGLANPRNIKPLFNIKDNQIIPLTCQDSLSNTNKLDFVKKLPGSKVLVYCSDSCRTTNYSVYGEEKYSKDSAICKAAAHDGKLMEQGKVEITFEDGMVGYKSSDKNGIKSKPKQRSDLTLTFKSINDEDEIILEPSTKIDFKDPNGPGFIPAVILEIKTTGTIVLTFEGPDSGSKRLEVPYPDKTKIFPCGDKVNMPRDCSKSRRNINKDKPIKIRFIPKNGPPATNGEEVDTGELFGKVKSWGWNRDMRNRIKIRQGGNKPELNTLVEFPAPMSSDYCNPPSPNVLCENNVTWSVKAGMGKFIVRIYVGDPQTEVRADIKVNGVPIIKEKTFPRGELTVTEGLVESINEMLTFSSECENNCKNQLSKMNMVEIFPYKDARETSFDLDNIITGPVKRDPCNGAQTGGDCDKGIVANCLFDDPTVPTASRCSGELFLAQIKTSQCKSQIGKFICVQKSYNSSDACQKICPGKCEKKNEGITCFA